MTTPAARPERPERFRSGPPRPQAPAGRVVRDRGCDGLTTRHAEGAYGRFRAALPNRAKRSDPLRQEVEPPMSLSIRNQIAGTVVGVAMGGAMASVTVDVNGGGLTAAITKDAVETLGLAAGIPVVALVKSTEVSLQAL
ncbi:TOBE domain-containing protein [Streptomyces sp. H27-S2]|uniref:TOBE domain-containing protein n=1 Tax=Streptomyces antarcticus TaxID=2996458 RepID=UPI003B635871